MSMELYILSDARLTSIAHWQRAIDADRSELRLSDQRPLADLHGTLPVVLNGKSTSFECDHWNPSDVVKNAPEIYFGRRWKYALAFRWGGDIDASVAAHAASAAYARATGGVILDCEEGKIISPKRALEISAEIAGSRAQIEAAVRMVIANFQKGGS